MKVDDRCDCCSFTARLSHINTSISSERRIVCEKAPAGNCFIDSRTDPQRANFLNRESTFLQCIPLQQAAWLQSLGFSAFTQRGGAKFCRLLLLTSAARVFRQYFKITPDLSSQTNIQSTGHRLSNFQRVQISPGIMLLSKNFHTLNDVESLVMLPAHLLAVEWKEAVKKRI